ncbi:MAG: glycosyltransferase [Pyrinomonadaceae bacterium]|nr:glycosyltransferase [Pyrinomonadaceae bacterium]
MTFPNIYIRQADKKSVIDTGQLVSVIIPCYNQAQFLGQAIESVLSQSYTHFEVIVIDDGSTDNTREIAALYPEVRTIHQNHAGTSTARNLGVRHSKGSCLVFLDSDDRLLPEALRVGLTHLLDHPECAFVFGRHRKISADGTVLSTNSFVRIEKDPYRQLLLDCCIYPPSIAMFRRNLFETVAGFDPLMVGTEDYDLYLRIARKFPIFGYDEVVAEYRRHDTNVSGNNAQMLRGCVAVLREQKRNVRGNKEWEEAYQIGLKNWRRHWGEELASEVWSRVREGREWQRSVWDMVVLIRYSPAVFPRLLARRLVRPLTAARNTEDLRSLDLE